VIVQRPQILGLCYFCRMMFQNSTNIILGCFVVLIFFASCDLQLGPTFNPKEDKLPKPIKNRDMGFKKLKGDVLFIDLKKNIYIKRRIKLPETKYQSESSEDRYFNLVRYKDTVLPLQKIVDIKSFQSMDSNRYEDMNHYYIYNQNTLTPPVFSCIEK
jgi:hypothetical protein